MIGNGFAATDVLIKERKPYGKTVRTRMPPQIMIDYVQSEFRASGKKWQTDWQTFVVEDDPSKDEYLIIARSVPKLWAFGLVEKDCPKPENYEQLSNDTHSGGTPVRLDVLIGVKRQKSWFRHTVTVYEPMYLYWKNPCYQWTLPPGKRADSFYKDNYTMSVYADNMKEKVFPIIKDLENWSPPKKEKKIPAIKGPGQETIGGATEQLTSDELKLPLEEQDKILRQRKENKK